MATLFEYGNWKSASRDGRFSVLPISCLLESPMFESLEANSWAEARFLEKSHISAMLFLKGPISRAQA
jgi:hypothetical protein